MKSFSSFISHFFRIVLIFLLFFIWVRFYEKNLTTCLLYTSILTFAFDSLLSLLIQKRDIKANLKKKEILEAEGFANYFAFGTKTLAVNFWNKVLSGQFKTLKKTNYIIFENEDNKGILYPFYSINKFSSENLVEIFTKLKNVGYEKVIICTNLVDQNALELAQKLPQEFIILDRYESYEKLMKKYNYFPEKSMEVDMKTKSKFKTFLAYSLNRKRAKGYIFASFILILSSFFVRVSVYYLFISSFLLLLAIFSFTNSTYNSNTPKDVL